MAMSKALGMYANERAVFEAVLAHGSGKLAFRSKSAAHHFRQRAYYYRKLLHIKQLESSGLQIAATSTPYDAIVMSIRPDNPMVVLIEEKQINAVFTPDQGKAITFSGACRDVASPGESDDEDKELLAFAEGLRLGSKP